MANYFSDTQGKSIGKILGEGYNAAKDAVIVNAQHLEVTEFLNNCNEKALGISKLTCESIKLLLEQQPKIVRNWLNCKRNFQLSQH